MRNANATILLLLICSSAFAGVPRQVLMPPVLDSLIMAGTDQTLRQEYVLSAETFRYASSAFPEHPAGYLYQAAVLQALSMDYEVRVDETTFDSLLAVVKDLSRKMIADDPGNPWGYFFLASMLGYDSYERSQQGDWFGAATKGLSSASNFEKAIQLDSSFYDAYAGIGTYYYWKTRKVEFLAWIPFVGDRREEGISFLRTCAVMGRYNRYAALSSLAAIYLDAGKYQEAEEVSQTALARYPGNRIFLWTLAAARDGMKRPDAALGTYEALLKEIVTDPRPNPYNELVCRLNLAKAKLQLGRDGAVRVDLDAIVAMSAAPFPEHLRSRAKEKIEEARELKQQLADQTPKK